MWSNPGWKTSFKDYSETDQTTVCRCRTYDKPAPYTITADTSQSQGDKIEVSAPRKLTDVSQRTRPAGIYGPVHVLNAVCAD